MIPLRDLHNFYDALSPAIRAQIDAVSSFVDMARGAVICGEGQLSSRLYQIVSGEVKVSSSSHDGREVVLAMIRRGDWVSFSEMFSGLPANADIIAITPVRLRVIHRTALHKLMKAYPEISEQILRVMSLRISMLCRLVIDRDALPLKERVAKTLYLQAFSHGLNATDQHLLISLSQEELAKLLGTSRQNLNKVLKELEREGMLQLSYGGVCLMGLEPIQRRYAHLVNVDQPVAVYPD